MILDKISSKCVQSSFKRLEHFCLLFWLPTKNIYSLKNASLLNQHEKVRYDMHLTDLCGDAKAEREQEKCRFFHLNVFLQFFRIVVNLINWFCFLPLFSHFFLAQQTILQAIQQHRGIKRGKEFS